VGIAINFIKYGRITNKLYNCKAFRYLYILLLLLILIEPKRLEINKEGKKNEK